MSFQFADHSIVSLEHIRYGTYKHLQSMWYGTVPILIILHFQASQIKDLGHTVPTRLYLENEDPDSAQELNHKFMLP